MGLKTHKALLFWHSQEGQGFVSKFIRQSEGHLTTPHWTPVNARIIEKELKFLREFFKIKVQSNTCFW